MKRIKQFFANNYLLILILLTALLFRGLGITWGFPLTLNNDESALVRSALGMRFGDFNPHYFDWPSLFRYLNFFLFWLFIKLRVRVQLLFGVETMRQALPFFWSSDPLPFYFIARLFSAFLGTATVYIVYRIGTRFFSKRVGLLSALLFALNYNHVINSQIATLDVGMTFFFSLGLLFALQILEKPRWRNYLLSGLFLGLATSTKYNAGMLCLVIAAASFLSSEVWLKKIKKLASAAVVSLLAFLAGTPYAILDWGTFWQGEDIHGFLWTFGRASPGSNWRWLVKDVFFSAWGAPLALLVIAGYLLFVIKVFREFRDFSGKLALLFLSFPIPYFLYLGSWAKPRGQYMLPMYLFEAIFAAVAFMYLRKAFLVKSATRAAATTTFVVLLIAIPIYKNTLLVYQKLILNDPRTQATEWIKENIGYGSAIAGLGTVAGDYGGDLPYIRRCSEGTTNCYQYYNLGDLNLNNCYTNGWEKWFSKNNIDYVVLGGIRVSNCFKDWLAGREETKTIFKPVWADISPTIAVINLNK